MGLNLTNLAAGKRLVIGHWLGRLHWRSSRKPTSNECVICFSKRSRCRVQLLICFSTSAISRCHALGLSHGCKYRNKDVVVVVAYVVHMLLHAFHMLVYVFFICFYIFLYVFMCVSYVFICFLSAFIRFWMF